MTAAADSRPCNRAGCETRVVLAKKVPSGKWVPYEATDRPAYTPEAIGCHVIVSGQAWRPFDLVEHFMVRHEISEHAARELVAGHPWHRPHFHATEKEPA
jgi:hypothetical protein